ncbi:MarR family winged helix-turn-helix transcriptional regulator [Streptomyces spongiae]|uniref:MarR family transcriptional regulator n=1 Tax=Streptomyces spongiae TaxID=565072 RepID=A0A5N8XCD6_9ACTN|nr:MarR family transcriptional regulator [Streptomyces spongiae]MPY56568.1 MarR family transcriptional regulator [Streptomyces spongiae]
MSSPRPIDDRLITTFGRLVEAYSQLERRLGGALQAETGLPHVWFEVLLRLARSSQGQLTMSTLADEAALTTSGVSRLVDRLLAAGYVERRPCPTDRRITYAAITDAGREVLDRAAVVHARNLRRTFADFDPDDLNTLDALLDRLRRTATA